MIGKRETIINKTVHNGKVLPKAGLPQYNWFEESN